MKRAQISPFMLGFLLALLGFVILAAALLPKFFNQGSLPDREACHLSVLARGTLSLSPGEPELAPIAEVTPLKCTTDKVCITDDFLGTCEPEFNAERARRVKVNTKDPASAARVIEQETANAMYDCWTMMGEGQVDLFAPQEDASLNFVNTLLGTDIGFKTTQPRCVVCSRIALDNTISEEARRLVDVNRYMAQEFVPGQTETYLQKFTDESVVAYSGVDKVGSNKPAPSSTSELAIVFMQIKTPAKPEDAFRDVAAGSYIVGGGGLLTAAGSVVVAVAGWPVTLVTLAGIGVTAGLAAYDAAEDSQLISAAYCGELTTDSEKAKVGCSMVKPIAWDAESINALCPGGLEGNL